jgi:imidazolonepropionase-like amidohydrolase
LYLPALVGPHNPPDEPESYTTLYAHNNLRQALQAGITTIRDVGAPDFISLSLKRAINEGVIAGPRLFVSGKIICVTGMRADPVLQRFVMEANGEAQIVESVRRLFVKGVDLIKMITGPIAGRDVDISPEELEAGIRAAHRLGLRVAVDTYESVLDPRLSDPHWPFSGADIIVRAGPDTLEHGWGLLSDDAVSRMVEQGTFWVPTCYILAQWESISEHYARREQNVGEAHRAEMAAQEKSMGLTMDRLSQSFTKALRAGVKIGAGTDAATREHTFAALPEEIELLTRFGMTPMQAIEAGTRVGAEALGQEVNLGTIETGKYADCIMVDKNPLEDITALKHVTWVMKGGKVIPFSAEYGRLVGKAAWAPK